MTKESFHVNQRRNVFFQLMNRMKRQRINTDDNSDQNKGEKLQCKSYFTFVFLTLLVFFIVTTVDRNRFVHRFF